MKKSKLALDIVLLCGLGVFALLAVAPGSIVMPGTIEMLLLGAVLVLLALFMVLLWNEKPADERELENQAQASRMAYMVGAIVLIGALAVQSLRHAIDPVIPITLLLMIAAKVIIQRLND